MLKVVNEEEFTIKLTEDDINDLAVDPPHGVLQMENVVSLYSLRLDKCIFT